MVRSTPSESLLSGNPWVFGILEFQMGVSESKAYLTWGPYTKDPTTKGAVLGSPVFGDSHFVLN